MTTATAERRRIIPVTMPDRSHLVIEITTERGHFSLSGLLYEAHGTHSGAARRRNKRDCDSAGQITDEIAAAAPGLAPIAAVHLADVDTGTPMHAVANGWHFYSGDARAYELKQYGVEYASRFGTDHERAARALHIAPDELPAGLDRIGFETFAATLAPRWADDARRALELIDSIPTLYALRGYDERGAAIRSEPMPDGILAPGARIDV